MNRAISGASRKSRRVERTDRHFPGWPGREVVAGLLFEDGAPVGI